MTYKIVMAPTALKLLKEITDRRVRDLIVKRIDDLKEDPEKQGKPLLGELSGYRSLKAAGQRYRIIYQAVKDKVLIYIVAIGIRKEGSASDIYTLAKKLIRLHLVDPRE
ncbi:MAG: plasmid stabilization protein [Nitrospirae bacterium GWC2_57_13]|nr:MAG: plasmid stabilization protein [Nitrospirae bacterium GWC2_57_13]HAS55518.1 plasmid stabilization protein [Nitrospiraceae bacterium]